MRKYSRSTPEILIDLLNEFGTLIRTEADLARTETSEKLTQLAANVGLIVGGAVLLIPALVILLEAAVNGLQADGVVRPWVAELIVGCAALVIGLALLAFGASRVRAKYLVPNRTLQQFQRDADVAKSQMRTADDDVQRAA
jgi:Putative Actinobacterial Holin-X, holin superfamily III